MTATQKLQKIADEKFGQDEWGKSEVAITFQRFTGFFAQHRDDSIFLGNSLQAERKLAKRDLR